MTAMESIVDVTIAAATKMAELYDDSGALAVAGQPTPERQAEWRIVAKRAIEASLELADELEAA